MGSLPPPPPPSLPECPTAFASDALSSLLSLFLRDLPSSSLFPRDSPSSSSYPFRPSISSPLLSSPSPEGIPRPLVFPTLSTLLLLLLLVITTNLSRINSPSGINSSKVQAWRRRKKLSRGGEGFVGEGVPGRAGNSSRCFSPLSQGEMENRKGREGDRSDEFLDLSRKSRDPSRCKGESFGSIEIFKLKFRLVIGLRKFFIV